MPKVVDHELRRDEITAAAYQAIAESGLDGATMRRIADLAECTTGRLNHYFDSHDEILVAALRYAHESAARRMQQAATAATGIEALRAVVLEALPLDRTRQNEWRVWTQFWGTAAHGTNLGRENDARYEEWHAALRQLLAAAFPTLTDLALETERLSALIDGLGLHLTLRPTKAARQNAIAIVERHLAELTRTSRRTNRRL